MIFNLFLTCELLQLNIVDGKMQYLFDESGRRYLDAFAGIAVVNCGHCHPDVVEPVINQIKRLQHPTVMYLNHAIADFSEALASKLPGDLKVLKGPFLFCFFFVFCVPNSLMISIYYMNMLASFYLCCFCSKFDYFGVWFYWNRWCSSPTQGRRLMNWRL